MLSSLRNSVLERWFETPQAKKIAAEIVDERDAKRRKILSTLEKLRAEREMAMVEPTKQLRAAKQELAAFKAEMDRRAAAVRTASRMHYTASRLHHAEIQRLEAELQGLEGASRVDGELSMRVVRAD